MNAGLRPDLQPDLLGRVAAHGLAAVADPLDADHPVELGAAEFDRLFAQVERHRLLGLFAAAVTDGSIRLDPADVERVADTHEVWGAHVLRIERLLLDLDPLLRAAGIEYRLFKGAALARSVYADPAHRLYADLDLLVPGDRFDRAVRLLGTELGGVPALPELRPGFDREFGKDATVRVGRVEVDLHRTFVTGPIGLSVPLDDLFGDAGSVVIAGRRLPTLAPIDTFLQTCLNAAVGDFPVRYGSLRDVAGLVAASDPDPAAVAEVARRWRSVAVVKRAIDETWRCLGLTPCELSCWAAEVRPGRVDRLLMRSYLTPARSYTRPAASLAVIPGFRARVRYGRALVRPQRAYLTARGWTQFGHARRAFDRLRRR
ncbi:MAG TPA: nucleotidyltransferase family protein [Ilumatobacter sp.]